MSALALTGFPHEGLTPYSTYHHTHSWHGQDAAEMHVVLATTGRWIAAEVFAAFSKSEGSDEINGSVELLAKDSIHKSRSKKILACLVWKQNLYSGPSPFRLSDPLNQFR